MSNYDHIQVETTQNVRLQYEIASIGDRIFAYILDAIIVYGLSLAIYFIYEKTVGFEGIQIKTVIGIVLLLFPMFFYHLLLEVFNNGQSVGKKILKIKVIRLDGTEPTLGNYAIRWLTRILEISGIGYGIALIVILINGKGQRLGDMAGGTTVAKVKKRVLLQDTILSFVHDNHVPTYPLAKDLSARDIEVIKEALHYFEKYKNHNILHACGMKVKVLMGIDPNTDFRPHVEFLTAVIDDYTYYKSREEN